jgi:F-type H+-transporting ATPase subunit epsilon
MAIPTKLTLEIVTPDRSLVNDEVDEVQLPGAEGYFGVLPGHTPLLATLQVGELWYRVGQAKHYLAVAFGFVEVLPDRVTVLAQIAERAQEIDVARAEAAKRRAEERVARAPQGSAGVSGAGSSPDLDFERARIALAKSLLRLQVASRARTRV